MSAGADPHYAIIDADVGWFRRHPRRRHRVGPFSQDEAQVLVGGPLRALIWYAAIRGVGDRAHQKIVIALPAKPTGGELSIGAGCCGVAVLVLARVSHVSASRRESQRR